MVAAVLVGFVARPVVAEPDVGAAPGHLDRHYSTDPLAAGQQRNAI
jgi:hypothetical protein